MANLTLYYAPGACALASYIALEQSGADDPAAIEEMMRKAPQVVGDCFDMIEAKMFAGPWVMGEDYSICDPYLFTLSSWLTIDDMDIARWPKVADHYARMSADPALARVIATEQAPV